MVRERSAKPLHSGSNPLAASRKFKGRALFLSRPLLLALCSVEIQWPTVRRSETVRQLRIVVRSFPGLHSLYFVNYNAPDCSGLRSVVFKPRRKPESGHFPN